MNRFKKRTIALVLASVVTVVGAFGAENYKNSLTGIKFEASSNGAINMIVQTKSMYDGNVTPIKKDANTFILTLPEMNSIASTPDLKEISGHITSVNVRTMPYSNTAKGYTRITIKTSNPSLALVGTNQVFIGDSKKKITRSENVDYSQRTRATYGQKSVENDYQKKTYQPPINNEESKSSNLQEVFKEQEKEVSQSSALREVPIQQEPVTKYDVSTEDNTYLWLWALLIVLGALFFYTRAKNKMQEIAGEKLNINVDNEKDEPEKKKLKKIKKTIKALDSAYAKTAVMPSKKEYTLPSTPVKTVKPAEELNIVDLDELFQEHKAKTSSKTKEEEENDALEEFLSGFSFDDYDEIEQAIEEESFDEELYEKIINNTTLKFTKEDLTCISKLLGTEINDDTVRNIEQYAVSDPVKKVVSKQEILEKLVTDYAISQNIIFTHEDIGALHKLINVELDKDFISDLRTNPQKTIEMEKDILAYGDKPKKPSEIITLNVKDVLPDLSEALKKQGKKKIESNYKADTVYYSEGYDVKKLSIADKLPDLSKEINKKGAFTSKPSAEVQTVDTNYVVGTGALKVNSELPNLKDVLANPDKYAEPEPEVIVDEEALLNNISNVKFKPFYDGTNDFEVLNDLSDIPTMSDVQAELNQFEGFEVSEEEPYENSNIQNEVDDFESIYNNEYVDLDKNNALNFEGASVSESTMNLIKKIEATKIEREKRRAKMVNKNVAKEIEDSKKATETESIKCILEGDTYNVVSSAIFEENKGCYLAKNEKGYTILGYIGDRLIKIQHYQVLKSEKIHARLTEKLDDGTSRYIVRVGLQKLIVSVKENDINFVMDLC